MKTLSFRAFEDVENNGYNTCNRSSDSRPLLVNCAGSFETEAIFETKNINGRDDYYLMLIIDGELDFGTTKKPLICKKGSLILYEPHSSYTYKHATTDKVNYLWIHFTGSHVKNALEEYRIYPFPSVLNIEVDDRLIMRYRSLFDAFSSFDELRERELSVLFDRLLLSLGRRLEGNVENRAYRLTKSISYINMRYNEKISIPTLARLEGLSVSRYNFVFKEILGISPTSYIMKTRINAAAEILCGTNMSVAEVGESVGYPDPHFFSKAFKSVIGLSPTDFRNGTKKH